MRMVSSDVFTRCVTVSGLQHVKNAQSLGKAVILLGIHATLDLGGRLTTMFTPLDVVYRPQNNPLLDWFILMRSRIYNDQISHRDMRHFATNVKNNHVVWITPDQDFGLKQGVMANFLGYLLPLWPRLDAWQNWATKATHPPRWICKSWSSFNDLRC